MRASGVLRSWNEERGFGFIAPERGGAELFVHISAFARDGSKPVVGETVSFELGRGPDGRPQAVKVVRDWVGANASARRADAPPATRPGSSLPGTLLLIAALLLAGGWGYRHYEQSNHRRQLVNEPAQPHQPVTEAAGPAQSFRCDGRTHCSQMTSCAEATWFVNNCPDTQMDGNRDGVPCEQQWCPVPGAR
jgi:cold shock CspA family protein